MVPPDANTSTTNLHPTFSPEPQLTTTKEPMESDQQQLPIDPKEETIDEEEEEEEEEDSLALHIVQEFLGEPPQPPPLETGEIIMETNPSTEEVPAETPKTTTQHEEPEEMTSSTPSEPLEQDTTILEESKGPTTPWTQ
jgi:hypothetical protein